MTGSLQGKASRAVVWSFADRVGQQGAQFLLSIVLARMLSPSEFGIIGVLAIFMTLADSFIRSGFGQALVQRGPTTVVEESSVFYFNILVGVASVALLWAGAPFIASFFKTPVLVPITRVMAFNLLINAFGLVQTTLLEKRLDFRTQVKAGMTGTVVSGVLAVTMAYYGYGVWSLVCQSVASNAVRCGLLWILSGWRPVSRFSRKALGDMFGYGSRLLVSGVIDTVFRNIYQPVIARLFSQAALGQYTMAMRISMLPADSLTTIVSRVTFPLFSAIRDDTERLKRSIRKSLCMMMLLNVPILLGLALVADNLVRVLLTAKWLPAVPYLQLWCVVALLLPIHLVNLSTLLALGRSDLHLRLEVIKKTLVLAFLSVAWRWGVTGLIVSQILISVIACHLNTYYVGRLIGYRLVDQLRDMLPIWLLGGTMSAAVLSLGLIGFRNATLHLVCQVALGGSVFVALGLLFRVRAFSDLHKMAQSLAGGRGMDVPLEVST